MKLFPELRPAALPPGGPLLFYPVGPQGTCSAYAPWVRAALVGHGPVSAQGPWAARGLAGLVGRGPVGANAALVGLGRAALGANGRAGPVRACGAGPSCWRGLWGSAFPQAVGPGAPGSA